MARRPIKPSIVTTPGDSPPPPPEEVVREAYARWASGVGILAVRDEGELVAMTMTAFAPLSLDPPLVVCCVAEQSPILPFIREVGRFGFSILPEGEKRAAILASSWFPPGELPFTANSAPVLESAVASFACRVSSDHPGGDHRIIIGAIEQVLVSEARPPLIYSNRAYRALEDGG